MEQDRTQIIQPDKEETGGESKLDSIRVMVNLITATTTEAGLNVQCGIDKTEYKTGMKVSDEDYAGINLIRNEFCGLLNYTVFQQ